MPLSPSISSASISSPAVSSPAISPNEIVQVAYRHARQLGLSREDAQDCAMDFRLHLEKSANTHPENPAWLHRSAHNFACNYLRSQMRRSRRERDWVEGASGAVRRPNASPSSPGPRTLTLRKLLWEQLSRLLRQCTPAQQELFVRYHVRRQSIIELAEHTGRTPHALRQSLSQMNRRFAQQLQQHGWSRTETWRIFFR
jgi:RNA polymerase sigma factor (sigma-70 family)